MVRPRMEVLKEAKFHLWILVCRMVYRYVGFNFPPKSQILTVSSTCYELTALALDEPESVAHMLHTTNCVCM